jgi:hypothetical protein
MKKTALKIAAINQQAHLAPSDRRVEIVII